MIIDCISDLHGHYPKLGGGDLLIVAGDLTGRDLENEVALFDYWMNEQIYKKKVVIAGNHDNVMAKNAIKLQFCDYLCDSETKFEGLKIWGSPWTKKFVGQNTTCMAFSLDTEEELEEKWALIPDDVDILITHSPIHGVLDKNIEDFHCGSRALRKQMKRFHPKLWVCGHIHESYGEFENELVIDKYFYIVNASHVNERYQPVNKPIRVIL